VVYDSKLCIAAFLVADVYLCRRLGLPNTQQVVFHFERNLQRGDILVPRTIQGIGLCVQSYPFHSFADCRINYCGVFRLVPLCPYALMHLCLVLLCTCALTHPLTPFYHRTILTIACLNSTDSSSSKSAVSCAQKLENLKKL